jgi:hypothetical protein
MRALSLIFLLEEHVSYVVLCGLLKSTDSGLSIFALSRTAGFGQNRTSMVDDKFGKDILQPKSN